MFRHRLPRRAQARLRKLLLRQPPPRQLRWYQLAHRLKQGHLKLRCLEQRLLKQRHRKQGRLKLLS